MIGLRRFCNHLLPEGEKLEVISMKHSLQICGELFAGGEEVRGQEVPEGQQADEGGHQAPGEEEDLDQGRVREGTRRRLLT